MAWIIPTLTLCQTRLAGAEWSSLSSAAKSSGQNAETMAQQVIDTNVTKVRGRVPPVVKLGAAGTIPDEMLGAFLSLWVYDFITRLPAMKTLLDDLRVKSWESANSELRDLANGKINLVPPVDAAPAAEQAAPHGIQIARQGRPVDDVRNAGLL